MRKRVAAITAAVVVTLGAACARAGEGTKLYTIETAAQPAQVEQGKQGSANIAIKVKDGAHISDEAPLKILVSGKNVKVAREKLARADGKYDDSGAKFEVPFTAESKGQGAVDADLTFYICKKELCEREVQKVSIPVTIK